MRIHLQFESESLDELFEFLGQDALYKMFKEGKLPTVGTASHQEEDLL